MTYQELLSISDYLFSIANRIGFDPTSNHANKAIAAICFELTNRIQKRLIGEIKKVYRVKLKPAEIEAVLYLKNEYAPRITPNTENAIIRLLQQQKSHLF